MKFNEYRIFLYENEKSELTIEKYLRDVKKFLQFTEGKDLNKQLVLEYKAELERQYSPRSANSMIAALNSYLKFIERPQLCVRQFKVQKEIYCSEDKELSKEEYFRLLDEAKRQNNTRLYLIFQTVCGTGIRISELEFITVEGVRKGRVTVKCKGKSRTVFIVERLKKQLLEYSKTKGITSGPIFVNSKGLPLCRVTVWRSMKSVCEAAGVDRHKVFPHNLRHLFARIFYSIEKDIVKLADILGHSNINTTRIYIITTGAEHRRRMENMNLVL